MLLDYNEYLFDPNKVLTQLIDFVELMNSIILEIPPTILQWIILYSF